MPWTATLISAEPNGTGLELTVRYQNPPREHFLTYLVIGTTARPVGWLEKEVANRIAELTEADRALGAVVLGPVGSPPPPPPEPAPPPEDSVAIRLAANIVVLRQLLRGIAAGVFASTDARVDPLRQAIRADLSLRPDLLPLVEALKI